MAILRWEIKRRDGIGEQREKREGPLSFTRRDSTWIKGQWWPRNILKSEIARVQFTYFAAIDTLPPLHLSPFKTLLNFTKFTNVCVFCLFVLLRKHSFNSMLAQKPLSLIHLQLE